jgi:hypothetical protein
VSARAHLDALFAKADAFFERVDAMYPTELACRSGCHDCCAPGLTVTAVEAAAIRAWLEAHPARADRAERPDRCAALGADGRCTIYPVRPLVCRTHGVPIKLSPEPGRRSLPVLDVCSKNFKGHSLEALDVRAVLDQRTLSTILAAIDAASGAERGDATCARVALDDLFARATPAT